MILDLSSLQDAIGQTDEALRYCRSDIAQSDPRLALHLRAGAIQAFEFTYELAFKTLKRFLIETEANPASIDDMSFNDIIRRGYEIGVIRVELADWKVFRRNRGITSHTYDAAKAQAIFEGIPAFLEEARWLLTRIAERQDAAS